MKWLSILATIWLAAAGSAVYIAAYFIIKLR